MSQHTVVLLLGSNLGNKENNIALAIKELELRVGLVEKKTKIIKSVAKEFVSTNFFCNIAIEIKCNLSPIKLLKVIKEIEIDLGRVKDSSFYKEYKDRLIDIDIIYFKKLVYKSEKLTIPHQKNLQRDFCRYLLKELNNIE